MNMSFELRIGFDRMYKMFSSKDGRERMEMSDESEGERREP